MDSTRTRSNRMLVPNPRYEEKEPEKCGGPVGKKQKLTVEQTRVKKDDVSKNREDQEGSKSILC